MRRAFLALSSAAAFLVAAGGNAVLAQSTAAFGTCVPRAQAQAGSIGCFIIVDNPVGVAGTKPLFWLVTRAPKRISTIASRHGSTTLVDAFGSKWLMTIGSKDASVNQGKLVARIGPLPVTPGKSYSALYMEASMTPGMKSAIHRHSGPEAWYTLSGETCLETTAGTSVGRAGGPPVIIPGGLPMELTATGKHLRRSLVLILHDSARPPTMMETTWKPTGSCNRKLH